MSEKVPAGATRLPAAGQATVSRQGATEAGLVCDNCGERNPVGSQFCGSCRAFLAWDAGTPAAPPATDGGPGPDGSAPTAPDPAAPEQPAYDPADPTRGLFRATLEQGEVAVPATGEPATLVLRLTNTSPIVDGYAVEVTEPPPWLVLEEDQVRLLPRTEEAVTVRLRVVSETLVPAQEVGLVLRVRSLSQAPAHLDIPVLVTVPPLDVPVGLRVEPQLLRVRDTDSGQCAVVVDNTRSNRPVRVRFAGSDPELAVRFTFEPPVLEVRPGALARARLVLTAPPPEPGQELSRPLVVTAAEDTRTVEARLTLHQVSSERTEDPLVGLELEPSVVRVIDSAVGHTRLTIDNRAGAEWAHLRLSGSDPERVVRVAWSQPVVHVPPGRTMQVEARFEAPLPAVGTEVSRQVTVSAADELRVAKATATFLQAASESPMAALAVRVEPSVVRVRDADTAATQVVVDNRRGRSGVRVRLDGSDPERVVRFGFSMPVVDVGPGQVQVVALRLDSLRPEPGQEATRQFTVSATDGQRTVEAPGSLVQASSQAAMELLAIRLDPSVLRLSNRRRARLTAEVDNRRGTQPVRVALHGDDPENQVVFRFLPAMLDLAPGQVARTAVTVRAPHAPAGGQVNRSFSVVATDGRGSVQAEGTMVQSSSELRPLLRLLLTLLGALLMVIGAFTPWHAVTGLTGMELDIGVLDRPFGFTANLGAAENLVSVGVLTLVLAGLVVFGLTSPTGKMTRTAAVLGVLLVVGLFIAFAVRNVSAAPASGAVTVVVGCVVAYVGGMLARR